MWILRQDLHLRRALRCQIGTPIRLAPGDLPRWQQGRGVCQKRRGAHWLVALFASSNKRFETPLLLF